jgi:hypothetical protein
VLVVTHDEPEDAPEGGVYIFVTEGIEGALEDAKAVAGDKDVDVMGGAEIGQQYIKDGLIDEISIHLVPAILGSIGTAVYRSEVAGAFPDGVPSGLAEAARDTLGGAVSVAGRLPDPLTAGLLDVAREAFTQGQGLQLTAITSAAIVVGMAVVALLLLRHAGLSSDAEGVADTAPDRSSPGPTAEKS